VRDDDGYRAGRREPPPRDLHAEDEPAEEPESDDDPGHRKRRHRDRVDQLPPAEPPGRQHRDDDAHRKRKQGRGARERQRVADRGPRPHLKRRPRLLAVDEEPVVVERERAVTARDAREHHRGNGRDEDEPRDDGVGGEADPGKHLSEGGGGWDERPAREGRTPRELTVFRASYRRYASSTPSEMTSSTIASAAASA